MLLMLLLMLVACTHDDAEVENLSHGDKYVSVRMHVPGMKSSFSRAAEDNLTSIVALVFRDDVLISNTEVLDLTPNSDLMGTFKIPQPNEGDIIHFLGNLPETVKSKLPETGGSQTDVLRNLETDDFSNLSYWGMATYSGGDIEVTLYRNMAKVEIAAGPNCTFRDDELYIAGLVKPIGKGTLVPYQEGFTFNLKEYDYNTLPNDLTGERYNNKLPSPVKSLYIFEHDNPGTADGLYVICEIGKYYYKVALIDENKEPYPIIRNHRYVIYVDDLDEGADSFEAAANSAPVNFTVKEIRDVTISVSSNQIDLNETLPVQVTVPDGSKLKELTITAPDFTITEGGNNLSQSAEGVYTFSGEKTGTTTYYFKPNSIGTGSITIAGSGDYLNNFSQTIQVTVSSSITAQADKLKLYYDSDEDQIVTVQATIPAGVTTLNIAAPSFSSVTANGGYTVGGDATNGYSVSLAAEGEKQINFTFTLDKSKYSEQTGNTSATITFSDESGKVTRDEVYINLEKTPVTEMSATSVTINMDNSETSATITLTKPVNEQNIKVTFDANAFIINDNQGHTSNELWINNSNSTIDIKFTLRNNNVSAGNYTVTFANGSGQMSTTATITIMKTPTVSFSNTGAQTLYWNNGSPTSFDVEMTGVPDGKNVTLSITNASAFTITDGSGNTVSNTYTGGNTTFTITPKDVGSVNETIPYSITFTDANDSDGVKVPNTSISVKVMNEKPAAGAEIVLWGNGEGEGNWGDWNNNNRDIADKVTNISDYYVVGNKIKVYFTTGNGNAKFAFRTGHYNLIGTEYTYTESMETSCTLDLDQPTLSKINSENGLVQIVATSVIITKISVIPASTTN